MRICNLKIIQNLECSNRTQNIKDKVHKVTEVSATTSAMILVSVNGGELFREVRGIS